MLWYKLQTYCNVNYNTVFNTYGVRLFSMWKKKYKIWPNWILYDIQLEPVHRADLSTNIISIICEIFMYLWFIYGWFKCYRNLIYLDIAFFIRCIYPNLYHWAYVYCS